jgi:serine phosphatase RsbU (regulator of sigma subunit)
LELLNQLPKPITSASGLLDQIYSALQHHIDTADQFDDITMLAVRAFEDVSFNP